MNPHTQRTRRKQQDTKDQMRNDLPVDKVIPEQVLHSREQDDDSTGGNHVDLEFEAWHEGGLGDRFGDVRPEGLQQKEGTVLEGETAGEGVVEGLDMEHVFFWPGLCGFGLNLMCLGVGPEPFEVFESGTSYIVTVLPGAVRGSRKTRVTQKMVQ